MNKEDRETVLVVAELWRRRVEFLWNMCEATCYEPLDIEKLDDMIIQWENSLASAGKRK